jgi:hypothetical protein
MSRTTQLQFVGSAGLADYKLNDLQDGKNLAARLKLEHALSATTGIGLNLSSGRTAAKDPAYSTTEWRIGLIGWRDVGRTTLTAEAEYGRLRAHDRLALLPERRSDRYSRFTLGATFRQLTVRRLLAGHPSGYRAEPQHGRIQRLQQPAHGNGHQPRILAYLIGNFAEPAPYSARPR